MNLERQLLVSFSFPHPLQKFKTRFSFFFIFRLLCTSKNISLSSTSYNCDNIHIQSDCTNTATISHRKLVCTSQPRFHVFYQHPPKSNTPSFSVFNQTNLKKRYKKCTCNRTEWNKSQKVESHSIALNWLEKWTEQNVKKVKNKTNKVFNWKWKKLKQIQVVERRLQICYFCRWVFKWVYWSKKNSFKVLHD